MSNAELIVAADFGTSNFRALVAELRADGGIDVMGGACVASAGFRDGDFVDLQSGSRAIQRVVTAAEAAADVDVSAFFFNVMGSHLRSLQARGQVQVGPTPRAIHEGDLEAAVAKARSLEIPFDQCILAVNPVDWSVDRVRGIVDPRGRLGSQLEVEAHLVTGSGSVVRNLERAVGMAGYAVAGRAVDVLATAEALLARGEREEGALLVDIGGRITQWALFRGGRPVGSGAVPWGGAHLTADLAHGLRVSLQDAEQIKRQRGVVLRSLVDETDTHALFEEERPAETPGLLAAVLEPRLEEILSLVRADLREPRLLAGLGRVVLTGGGSRCRGTAALAEEVFGAAAECRWAPAGVHGLDRLGEAFWGTALGLALWVGRTREHPLAAVAAAGAAGEAPVLWRRLRGLFNRPGRPAAAGGAEGQKQLGN